MDVKRVLQGGFRTQAVRLVFHFAKYFTVLRLLSLIHPVFKPRSELPPGDIASPEFTLQPSKALSASSSWCLCSDAFWRPIIPFAGCSMIDRFWLFADRASSLKRTSFR